MRQQNRLALFLGSGFSAALGLPVTSKLQDRLLDRPPAYDALVTRREEFINKVIARFWTVVFGWKKSSPRPSLEDHFTEIDLAANSGHYLGQLYGPKKLRAIRRMTIHRVFKLLDVQPTITTPIQTFVKRLTDAFSVSIITTNWDIMAERCLEHQAIPFSYASNETDIHGSRIIPQGVLVLKLHGSGNWGYCDCCRSLIAPEIRMGKIAVHFHWLLEPYDFELFHGGRQIARDLKPESRNCLVCGGRIAVRVATFSYRKHLDVPFFQQIWDEARTSLAHAERWLFVGYSMPEADIEIRHLIKTAQLARKDVKRLTIDVVLKNDPDALDRYRRFFGLPNVRIHNHGFEEWITSDLDNFCRNERR